MSNNVRSSARVLVVIHSLTPYFFVGDGVGVIPFAFLGVLGVLVGLIMLFLPSEIDFPILSYSLVGIGAGLVPFPSSDIHSAVSESLLDIFSLPL